MNGRAWNLKNQRFGRLVALERVGQKKDGHYTWLCVCDCGNTTIVSSNHLKSGNTKSCGCFQRMSRTISHKTHGESKTRLFAIWANMLQRCNYPNASSFHRYGGRGIRVCVDWNDYTVFSTWAKSNGYQDDLTIDRINNDGNYEPSNCRWITNRDQSNNRKSTHHFTFNGETHTLHEWAAKMGISYSALRTRYYRGKPLDEMFAEVVK